MAASEEKGPPSTPEEAIDVVKYWAPGFSAIKKKKEKKHA